MRNMLTSAVGLVMVAALSLPASAGAESEVTALAGSAQALACPTTTLCYAVAELGPLERSQTGVVTIVGGHEKRYQRVRSAFSLSGISCPTSGFCLAVGSTPSLVRGVLVEVRNGKIAKTSQLPWVPDVVDCPSAEGCVIVGHTMVHRNKIVFNTLLVAVVSGTTVKAFHEQRFSGKSVGAAGLSCASTSACELAGSTEPGGHYFFEAIGAGATLGSPHFSQLLDTDNDVGVACPAGQSICYLTGRSLSAPQGVLYSATIGGSTLTQVSTFNAELFHLSCLTVAQCTGAGDGVSFETGPAGPPPALDTFTNGQPGPVQEQFPGLLRPIDGGGFTDVVTTSATTWSAIAPSATKRKTAFIRGTIS
jgi:hypothetical protein